MNSQKKKLLKTNTTLKKGGRDMTNNVCFFGLGLVICWHKFEMSIKERTAVYFICIFYNAKWRCISSTLSHTHTARIDLHRRRLSAHMCYCRWVFGLGQLYTKPSQYWLATLVRCVCLSTLATTYKMQMTFIKMGFERIRKMQIPFLQANISIWKKK